MLANAIACTLVCAASPASDGRGSYCWDSDDLVVVAFVRFVHTVQLLLRVKICERLHVTRENRAWLLGPGFGPSRAHDAVVNVSLSRKDPGTNREVTVMEVAMMATVVEPRHSPTPCGIQNQTMGRCRGSQ
jgi:hypothetical protein